MTELEQLKLVRNRLKAIGKLKKVGATVYRNDLSVEQAVYVVLSQPDQSTSFDDFIKHAPKDIKFLIGLVDRAIEALRCKDGDKREDKVQD